MMDENHFTVFKTYINDLCKSLSDAEINALAIYCWSEELINKDEKEEILLPQNIPLKMAAKLFETIIASNSRGSARATVSVLIAGLRSIGRNILAEKIEDNCLLFDHRQRIAKLTQLKDTIAGFSPLPIDSAKPMLKKLKHRVHELEKENQVLCKRKEGVTQAISMLIDDKNMLKAMTTALMEAAVELKHLNNTQVEGAQNELKKITGVHETKIEQLLLETQEKLNPLDLERNNLRGIVKHLTKENRDLMQNFFNLKEGVTKTISMLINDKNMLKTMTTNLMEDAVKLKRFQNAEVEHIIQNVLKNIQEVHEAEFGQLQLEIGEKLNLLEVERNKLQGIVNELTDKNRHLQLQNPNNSDLNYRIHDLKNALNQETIINNNLRVQVAKLEVEHQELLSQICNAMDDEHQKMENVSLNEKINKLDELIGTLNSEISQLNAHSEEQKTSLGTADETIAKQDQFIQILHAKMSQLNAQKKDQETAMDELLHQQSVERVQHGETNEKNVKLQEIIGTLKSEIIQLNAHKEDQKTSMGRAYEKIAEQDQFIEILKAKKEDQENMMDELIRDRVQHGGTNLEEMVMNDDEDDNEDNEDDETLSMNNRLSDTQEQTGQWCPWCALCAVFIQKPKQKKLFYA